MENNAIHYGCGFVAPSEWANFDASPTLVFEKIPIIGQLYTRKSVHKQSRFPKNVRYGDIVKGLPVKPGTAEVVYCSHVLEHLAYYECLKALENTYVMLKKGGTFRFVLPDLKGLVETYINTNDHTAAVNFMKISGLCMEKRPTGLKSFIFEWLSNSKHLWLWDYNAMKKACEDAGFSQVRRAYFGDYSEKACQFVEQKQRWDGCLGLECIK